MTYDIGFYADATPAGGPEGWRAAWGRIARRVAREVGPVTVEEHADCLTLLYDGPEGRLRLDHRGTSAFLTLGYRYRGEAASRIVATAYRLARVVEEESGLVGHDHQTDLLVRDGDVRAAAALLGEVSDRLRGGSG